MYNPYKGPHTVMVLRKLNIRNLDFQWWTVRKDPRTVEHLITPRAFHTSETPTWVWTLRLQTMGHSVWSVFPSMRHNGQSYANLVKNTVSEDELWSINHESYSYVRPIQHGRSSLAPKIQLPKSSRPHLQLMCMYFKILYGPYISLYNPAPETFLYLLNFQWLLHFWGVTIPPPPRIFVLEWDSTKHD